MEPGFLGRVMEADEEVQIGLRSAAVLAGDEDKIFHLEQCLARAVTAVEKVEEMLVCEVRKNRNAIGSIFFEKNETILRFIESDILWKQELLDAIPIPASAEQLTALATLVKARPFLGKLVDSNS